MRYWINLDFSQLFFYLFKCVGTGGVAIAQHPVSYCASNKIFSSLSTQLRTSLIKVNRPRLGRVRKSSDSVKGTLRIAYLLRARASQFQSLCWAITVSNHTIRNRVTHLGLCSSPPVGLCSYVILYRVILTSFQTRPGAKGWVRPLFLRWASTEITFSSGLRPPSQRCIIYNCRSDHLSVQIMYNIRCHLEVLPYITQIIGNIIPNFLIILL